MKARSHGFSLIELLAVMAILGVLAVAALPMAELVRQREQERELKQALWELRAAIDAYKRAYDEGSIVRSGPASGFPAALSVLVAGQQRAGPNPGTTYFLRRLPRDPFAPADLPAQDTWDLRSYESPPEAPRPGSDVYDVHSKSDRVGLNGVPLRQW